MNDGKFVLDGKRVKFSDYGGSSIEEKKHSWESHVANPTYLFSDNSPYKRVKIDYSTLQTSIDSVMKQIPEATTFRYEDCDEFGPLTMSFTAKGVRYWYG